jgi:hypothetical protein
MDKLPLLREERAAVTGSVVIAGSLAQKPWYGGHTWVFLQYLLGFRKLGWTVLLLDRLEPDMYVGGMDRTNVEESENVRYFRRVMADFQLEENYSILLQDGARTLGLSRAAVLERVSGADLFLNVMGFLDDEEILSLASNRVFLDIDPGFGQMWQELGLHTMFSGHDHYVTIGENIGKEGCGIPTCGLNWITTRQPVVLDHWSVSETRDQGFTTVCNWRGEYGPVPFQGKTYGLRAHEFRKFVSLPIDTGERFELALDIHDADDRDKALLHRNGWSLSNPKITARGPAEYRSYIQRSAAEFMVAKNMYVDTRSGWFSDRSICYLASGKPVLAQDTGLQHLYPCDEGLLTFESNNEAIDKVGKISRDYSRHARAARNIATEFFDSNKVLTSLLNKL